MGLNGNAAREQSDSQFEGATIAAELVRCTLKGADDLTVDIVEFDSYFFVGADGEMVRVLFVIDYEAKLHLVAWTVAVSVCKKGDFLLLTEGIGLISTQIPLGY